MSGQDRGILQAKQALRDQVRTRLSEITPPELYGLSILACENVSACDAFRHARTIMMYAPLAQEVDVSHIALRCFQQNRTVCLPKIDWEHRRMWPVPVNSFDDCSLVPDRHGLRVPERGCPMPIEMIDLVIVPGVAFDSDGHRLGRGGGYYDRFLGQTGFGGRCMALCFDCQIVDSVPRVAHDVVMDYIATERRLIHVDPAVKGHRS
ncbi:MAG: 5-formyltetrahydrofolate cyclo-ligase [Phycisphaerales bacterium]|nr:5-formyltetrahydrofolate cyclo-ligase [Phycisphaerales bacterium]